MSCIQGTSAHVSWVINTSRVRRIGYSYLAAVVESFTVTIPGRCRLIARASSRHRHKCYQNKQKAAGDDYA